MTDLDNAAAPVPKPKRQRGQGDFVGMTIRMTPEQWRRVRHFAVDEGKSIQTLVIEGLSKQFAEKGLPEL